MKGDILLIQPHCGKYDIFILDMPLSLLYTARMLVSAGYRVHVLDQRVEKGEFWPRLKGLLDAKPLYAGVTVMTGEPVKHALEICRFIRAHSTAPLVWGGIHPTILPEQTLASPLVDYVIKGKGERAALHLAEALAGQRSLDGIPGLSYKRADGAFVHHAEDDEDAWDETPLVPYDLIDVGRYYRVGFEGKVFSIMTSRNCPMKCTFCYNSALTTKKKWKPDGLDYTLRHIDFILERYKPDYLSFIDDDFFINKNRAWEILSHLERVAPPTMKVGFRGARVAELVRLPDEYFDLMERVRTTHINIGVESGSPRVLKLIKKGMTVDQAVELNRRLALRPSFVPLYNFFSGIPQETEEDIKMTTALILQLVKDNPYCQVSGYHQYTPYPGNALYKEAVAHGFPEPQTLEEWGELRFEDNARNCPWIDRRRRRLLEMVYSMVYFVDSKYDMYIADSHWALKALYPVVKAYKPVARFRLRHHLTALPLEVMAKDLFYRLYYTPS